MKKAMEAHASFVPGASASASASTLTSTPASTFTHSPLRIGQGHTSLPQQTYGAHSLDGTDYLYDSSFPTKDRYGYEHLGVVARTDRLADLRDQEEEQRLRLQAANETQAELLAQAGLLSI